MKSCIESVSRNIIFPGKVWGGRRTQWSRVFLWHKSADWLWNANLVDNSITPFINNFYHKTPWNHSTNILCCIVIYPNWNTKISITLLSLLFVCYLQEKIRCAGKTVFVRLTARSSRYYCSISCQPRNKVIKHCFTRHKDALFFFNWVKECADENLNKFHWIPFFPKNSWMRFISSKRRKFQIPRISYFQNSNAKKGLWKMRSCKPFWTLDMK